MPDLAALSESDQALARDLMRDEGRVGRQTPAGFVHVAYPDPLSLRAQAMHLPTAKRPKGWETLPGAPWTIGYGHTGRDVYEGLTWTEAQARAALARDILDHNTVLDAVLPWISGLDPLRRRVLQNMHFNLGWDNPRTPKLEGLSGFTQTLPLIRGGDYVQAARNLSTSLWARQVGDRAARLIDELRTGRYGLKPA